MSPKKIFIAITIVIIAIVFISVTMIYLLSQKEETISQEPVQNEENNSPVTLPSNVQSSGSEENVKEVQKIFENTIQETISEKTKGEGSKRIDFKNQKGSAIPLSDFKKTLDVEIDLKLQEYLGNDYQTFYCPGSDGKKEFGVYLEYNMDKLYRGFTFDVLDMMKNWEGAIFPDLHTILFPNVYFSENELNQKIEFRDGKYRYAGVNLPDGKKGSIQYDMIEFGVVVATSPACLDNVEKYYKSID